ncbi:DUF302 domain-containing protein [Mesorhizobium sp.]|uniref:DUF302 domain-containing protein n=1 Tax=Mesorhizobium sp. TaxID=1871066 RepID=UPI001221A9C4|nr:DUF302 domain-containing protein [Mesorhizobium sp.]TIP10431.1 MAG: DUF302 domain-containing protein [Mesorhizobium sp.]
MKRFLLPATLLASAWFWVASAAAQEDVTTYTVSAEFTAVMGDLEDGIVNRGYVVDYRGHIGEMLKRTSVDVAGAKPLYRNAEFIQFCSAVISRRAMEADIGNIAYCPYILFGYETEEKPGDVIVGFRRLPDGEGRDDVNDLLDEIAKDAAGE